MSTLIMCDDCKKRMNRQYGGLEYHEITIDDCEPPLHLCDECFNKMIENTFHVTKEDLHINGRLYFS